MIGQLALAHAIAVLSVHSPAPAKAPIVAEAEAFMQAYADDLLKGDRKAIADRYSRKGAYALGWTPKTFESHAEITRKYASQQWQKPEAFEWRDLSYEPLSEDSIAVVGNFMWGAEGMKPLMAYTSVLRREEGGLRLIIEHENLVKQGAQ